MGAIAYQITSLTIVYSTVYSDAAQRKHQSSASLAFVRGIRGWPVDFPHKWPVTPKIFPFDDVIMYWNNIVMPWHGNACRITGFLWRESTVADGFPCKETLMRKFHAFLSTYKFYWSSWWFKMSWLSFHINVRTIRLSKAFNPSKKLLVRPYSHIIAKTNMDRVAGHIFLQCWRIILVVKQNAVTRHWTDEES